MSDLPVIEGELVGFRQWSITRDWKLAGVGVGQGQRWTPGVNTAMCTPNEAIHMGKPPRAHKAPGAYCDCGFNAYAKPNPGWKDYEPRAMFTIGSPRQMVPGAILGWGDEFYMHPGGFRAQHARPVLLAVCDGWPHPFVAAVRAVAEEYGCEVCDFAILEAAAREHGQLVPTDAMPEPGPTLSVSLPTLSVSLSFRMPMVSFGTLLTPVERARQKHQPRAEFVESLTRKARPPRTITSP